jgi:hypothetical protein
MRRRRRDQKVLKHLRKGMYSVQTFAGILQSLAWLAQDVEYEKGWEKDASTVPADLRTALQLLCEIFKKMSAEETDELIASISCRKARCIEVIELAAMKVGELARPGKRHSKADQEMIQAVHDTRGAGRLRRGREVGESVPRSHRRSRARCRRPTTESLEKGHRRSRRRSATSPARRDTLTKRVTYLEAQPAPEGRPARVDKATTSTDLTKRREAAEARSEESARVMKVHAGRRHAINADLTSFHPFHRTTTASAPHHLSGVRR